jgi:LysM repeat protein
MRRRSITLALGALLLTEAASGAGPSAAAPSGAGPSAAAGAVAAVDPAVIRLKELLTSGDGQLRAPASPRFASLRDPSLRGTRFVVGWLLPARSTADGARAATLVDALGRDGDGGLSSALPALGGRVAITAALEDVAGTPILVVAVSSTRRGVGKELELGVLDAVARLGDDASAPYSGLARRALSPLSRVVVEVHPPDAPRVGVRLPRPVRHVIERGDTLSEIAQNHGLDLEALVRLNGMDPKKPIHPGFELKLDAGGPRPKLYVAKPGDTLAKVAKHFGVSEKALLDVNRTDMRRLSPGQKLVLPR